MYPIVYKIEDEDCRSRVGSLDTITVAGMLLYEGSTCNYSELVTLRVCALLGEL